MAIYERFSTRQKKLSKQGDPDPYCYDIFPQPLRVQVINLLNSTLGNYDEDYPRGEESSRWDHIHRTLAHEYGVFELAEGRNSQKRCVTFFLKTGNVEKCFDFVELGYRWVCILVKKYSESQGGYAEEQERCEQAIKELLSRPLNSA